MLWQLSTIVGLSTELMFIYLDSLTFVLFPPGTSIDHFTWLHFVEHGHEEELHPITVHHIYLWEIIFLQFCIQYIFGVSKSEFEWDIEIFLQICVKHEDNSLRMKLGRFYALNDDFVWTFFFWNTWEETLIKYLMLWWWRMLFLNLGGNIDESKNQWDIWLKRYFMLWWCMLLLLNLGGGNIDESEN